MSKSWSCLSLLLLSTLLLSLVTAQDEQHNHDLLSSSYEDKDMNLLLMPSPTNIFVMWDLVADAEFYHLTWTDDVRIEGNDDVDSSTEWYTIDDLPPCTQFQVQVYAMEGNDTLRSDNGTTQTGPQASNPVKALDVRQVEEEGTLAASWSSVKPPGNCLLKYRVTWNPSNGTNETMTTETQYNITDLEYDERYEVCVIPSVEGEEPSFTKCVVQPVTIKPEESPENITVTDAGVEFLTVAWDPPVLLNVITGYAVTWRPESDQEDSEDSAITTDTTYGITSLLPCTRYTVTVSVGNDKGFGPPADPITNQTLGEAPEAPQNLTVTDRQTKTLTVVWDPPKAVGNCELLGYNITWEDSMDPKPLEKNSQDYTITGLKPGKSYNISIKAQNAWGWGPYATLGDKTKTSGNDTNVGAIVGGVVGGLVLVALVVAAVLMRDSIKNMAKKSRGKSRNSSRRNSMTMDYSHKM